MPGSISSVAFSHDNQNAFISDWNGMIKKIRWQANANSGDEFDFTEEPKKVGMFNTPSICLTKDEKYLLVGSRKLVSVYKISNRKITKYIKMQYDVMGISLIKDGTEAIIAEEDGKLSVIDLKTLQITISKNITNGIQLAQIIVI